MAQEYISQVSEEIEGRVIKKLSKEFSRTDSRIMAALSKLDEFLLNPQVPGTSRNNNSENREPTGDRSVGDLCPEAVFFACHPSNLNYLEQDETHHNWWSTKFFFPQKQASRMKPRGSAWKKPMNGVRNVMNSLYHTELKLKIWSFCKTWF